jgi:hypothetical protein
MEGVMGDKNADSEQAQAQASTAEVPVDNAGLFDVEKAAQGWNFEPGPIVNKSN